MLRRRAGSKREENRLVNKLVHQADAADAQSTDPTSPPSSAFVQHLADASLAAQNARREKRARRRNLQIVPSDSNDASALLPSADDALTVPDTQTLVDHEIRRSSREARRTEGRRPRAPRAEAERIASDSVPSSEIAGPHVEATDDALIDADSNVANSGIEETDARNRLAERARRKQEYAVSATESETSAPVALNRHLILVTEQLTAAHRVIGRVTAERDGLRQQIAEIKGIAFEDVVIPSLEPSSESEGEKRNAASASGQAPSRLQRLNYFGVDDYALMRKRRQGLVLALLGVVLLLWMSSRVGFWSMPDNLSRESLGHLPLIGDLMTYFLAGWLFFRVIKVSSKGVRWVFPSDNRGRRRR